MQKTTAERLRAKILSLGVGGSLGYAALFGAYLLSPELRQTDV
jgi:hypothetical protein